MTILLFKLRELPTSFTCTDYAHDILRASARMATSSSRPCSRANAIHLDSLTYDGTVHGATSCGTCCGAPLSSS